jgi:hypothetical protein
MAFPQKCGLFCSNKNSYNGIIVHVDINGISWDLTRRETIFLAGSVVSCH